MKLLAWNEKPSTKYLRPMSSFVFAIAIASSIYQKQKSHAQTLIHCKKLCKPLNPITLPKQNLPT
jgi:hypothetical protein